MALELKEILLVFENIESAISENKQFLTDLDAAIGDGDHGINLNKGFKALGVKLKAALPKDWGEIFKIAGMAIVSNVGGASGPLYGTAFMKAAPLGIGKVEMNLKDFGNILNASINGIKQRGNAEKGDKTMLDAIMPAYDEIIKAIESNSSSLEALKSALNAAEAGTQYTKTIAARKGRASYLGDRSIGYQDPGATSSSIMLRAVYETVKALEGK